MDPYFAYGCNVGRAHMASLCPSAHWYGLAVLGGHRLVFPRRCSEWGGGVASVESAADHEVQGVLYTVDAAALASLDAYEEVHLGAYRRERMTVQADTGPCDAWVYRASPVPGGPFPPSPRYRAVLVAGLLAAGGSPAYIAALRRLPTRPTAYT